MTHERKMPAPHGDRHPQDDRHHSDLDAHDSGPHGPGEAGEMQHFPATHVGSGDVEVPDGYVLIAVQPVLLRGGCSVVRFSVPRDRAHLVATDDARRTWLSGAVARVRAVDAAKPLTIDELLVAAYDGNPIGGPS